MNPNYQMPGATETQSPYGGDGSSMETKYMQIKKQLEQRKEAEQQKTLKQTVKNENEFKKDMAKFYGVNPGATKDVELSHFVGQQGKENSLPVQQQIRPQTVPVEHSDRQSHAASQQQLRVSGGQDDAPVTKVSFAGEQRPQSAFQSIKPIASSGVNVESQLFQRNAAKFYGAHDQWEGKSISSQGSIFQKNAAAFYGVEPPAPG